MDAVVAWAALAWAWWSVELQRLTHLSLLQWRWQGRLQGLGVGNTGGLNGCCLGLQALQFLIAKLHTDQLRRPGTDRGLKLGCFKYMNLYN